MTDTASSGALRYAAAVADGRTPLGRSTVSEQALTWFGSAVRTRVLCLLVRAALAADDIQSRQASGYYAFALQLDRLCRRYGGRTLQLAGYRLVERWRQRGLRRPVIDRVRLLVQARAAAELAETGKIDRPAESGIMHRIPLGQRADSEVNGWHRKEAAPRAQSEPVDQDKSLSATRPERIVT